MPSPEHSPPQPSWRKGGTPDKAGSSPRPADDPSRSWRRRGAAPPAPGRRRPWGRWTKGGLSALSAVVCAGLILMLSRLPGCVNTQIVVVSVPEYEEVALPPNAALGSELQALQALVGTQNFAEKEGRIDFEAWLAGLPRKTVLVLSLNLLAGRDRDGLYFYPNGSDPDNPETFLRPKLLWDALAKLPRQRKLLLLDVSRVQADWRLGLLETQLLDEFDSAANEIPNLVILASAGPGEMSWSSAELGGSVFGHFVELGLSGQADLNGDHRIKVGELYEYVRDHTQQWVYQNRDRRGQHPTLIPALDELDSDHDFDVLSFDRPADVERLALSKFNSTLRGELRALWDDRDRLAEKGRIFERDPLRWRQFLYRLRQAEAWLLARNEKRAKRAISEARETLEQLQAADQAAERWERDYPFVAANLHRPKSPARAVEPELPERQLRRLLEAYAPESTSPELRQQAVRVAELAERIAWNSPEAVLSVLPVLREGDQMRLQGEDRLFLDRTMFPEAVEHLQSAEQHYQRAADIAQVIQRATKTHALLLAKLPDLAQWAADRVPVSDQTVPRREQLLTAFSRGIDRERFEPPTREQLQQFVADDDEQALQLAEVQLLILFDLARSLSQRLEALSVVSRVDELADLRRMADDADQMLQDVRNRLSAEAEKLASADLSQPQPEDWLRLWNMLRDPDLPAEVRAKLLEKLLTYESSMHNRHEKLSSEDRARLASPKDHHDSDGLWQGLWALNVLSLGTPTPADLHQLWVDWKAAQLERSLTDRHQRLAALGASIRRLFHENQLRLRQHSAGLAGTLGETRGRLVLADRMTRGVQGYDAEQLVGRIDPARDLREFDLGVLCVHQAERYLDDYWAATEPGARNDWYVDAAQNCLAASRQPSEKVSALRQRLQEVNDLLARRRGSRLQVESIGRVDLSLRPPHELRVPILRQGDVPQGLSAVWVEASSQDLLRVEAGRKPVSSGGGAVEFQLERANGLKAENCHTVPLKPWLLFRGHQLTSPELVVVNPCPPKGVRITYQPPASKGSIIVYGTDRRPVMFVLDCSGSMGETLKSTPPRTRFAEAKQVLQDSLRSLAGNDPPQRIGLLAYGHRSKIEKKKTVPNPDWRDPLGDPPPSDALRDYQCLNPLLPLDNAQYRIMQRTIDSLSSFGNTPLVGAMIRAVDELTKNNAERTVGTVVAITDGAAQDDGRPMLDPNGRPILDRNGRPMTFENRLPELESRLKNHPGVDLFIVGFAVEGSDAAALNDLARKTRNGRFVVAPDGRALGDQLRHATQQRPYVVESQSSGTDHYEQPLNTPLTDLIPRDYALRFAELPPVSFRIDGGEQLVFDVTAEGLVHRQHPQGTIKHVESVPLGDEASPVEPNRFGYRMARLTGGRRAEFLFFLDRGDDNGFVRRPEEVWIEVSPGGTRQRLSAKSQLEPNESVPAWRVTIEDWPPGPMPEVRAVWKMQRTRTDARLSLKELLSGAQSIRLNGNGNATLRCQAEQAPGRITVEITTELGGQLSPPSFDLANLRVELGNEGIREEFKPLDLSRQCEYYEKGERTLVCEFGIGERTEIEKLFVGLTTRQSREQGARTLRQPMQIGKWDHEQ